MVIQDADLEYDPQEYVRLLQPILRGQATPCSVPVSSVGITGWHAVGNRFLTLLSNMFSNLNLTDMETGYKVVTAPLLKRLVLTSERFGFEPEITARLAQAGARVWEIGISYSGRTYTEGKKIRWWDGLAALGHIVRFNLFPPKAQPSSAPLSSVEHQSLLSRESRHGSANIL